MPIACRHRSRLYAPSRRQAPPAPPRRRRCYPIAHQRIHIIYQSPRAAPRLLIPIKAVLAPLRTDAIPSRWAPAVPSFVPSSLRLVSWHLGLSAPTDAPAARDALVRFTPPGLACPEWRARPKRPPHPGWPTHPASVHRAYMVLLGVCRTVDATPSVHSSVSVRAVTTAWLLPCR